jgi:hypothetical protein
MNLIKAHYVIKSIFVVSFYLTYGIIKNGDCFFLWTHIIFGVSFFSLGRNIEHAISIVELDSEELECIWIIGTLYYAYGIQTMCLSIGYTNHLLDNHPCHYILKQDLLPLMTSYFVSCHIIVISLALTAIGLNYISSQYGYQLVI